MSQVPTVGIIANPVSARDIRRVVANATSLQITDRANIVLRVLAALKACGVDRVLVMPEAGGIRGHVERGLTRATHRRDALFPDIEYVSMPITGTVTDTQLAARRMAEAGVAAIVVLGGDGTHRAVVAECGQIPIAGISTGTNNAFPEHREPTITGLAAGLMATGRVPRSVATLSNKRLDVSINGDQHDIALVDIALVRERYIGARALWRPDNFRELYVTFADPEVIGMSAIAGLLCPVSRREPGGVYLRLEHAKSAARTVHAPIAPGMIIPVGVKAWEPMPANQAIKPGLRAGSIALDGERELSFSEQDEVTITLVENAFQTVDVSACMQFAARHGLQVGDGTERAITHQALE